MQNSLLRLTLAAMIPDTCRTTLNKFCPEMTYCHSIKSHSSIGNDSNVLPIRLYDYWVTLKHVTFLNTLRPRQNGRHFADDIFKCIFLNEIVWISLKISLKFVPKFRINIITALVQIMAWCRPDDKPLFGPLLFSLLTHICVTRLFVS